MTDARALQAEVERLTARLGQSALHWLEREDGWRIARDEFRARAVAAEARLAEVEKERDNAYDSCIKITQREVDAILRAEAAEARLAELAESRAEMVVQRNAYYAQQKRYRAALEGLLPFLPDLHLGGPAKHSAHAYAVIKARAALAGGEGEKA